MLYPHLNERTRGGWVRFPTTTTTTKLSLQCLLVGMPSQNPTRERHHTSEKSFRVLSFYCFIVCCCSSHIILRSDNNSGQSVVSGFVTLSLSAGGPPYLSIFPVRLPVDAMYTMSFFCSMTGCVVSSLLAVSPFLRPLREHKKGRQVVYIILYIIVQPTFRSRETTLVLSASEVRSLYTVGCRSTAQAL